MPLTDTAVRNTKAKDKPFKLSDEKGLYLPVSAAGKVIRFMEKDVFPWLGNRPIKDITVPDLLQVLRQVENVVHWN